MQRQQTPNLRAQAVRLGWLPARHAADAAYRRFISIMQNVRTAGIHFELPTSALNRNSYSGEYRFVIRRAYNPTGRRYNAIQLNAMSTLVSNIRSIVILWENLNQNQWMQFGFSDGVQRFYTRFTTISNLTAPAIVQRISDAIQSNGEFDLNNLTIIVRYSLQRRGGGGHGVGGNAVDLSYPILKKTSVYTIEDSTDNLCFFRALAVCLAYQHTQTEISRQRFFDVYPEPVDPITLLKNRRTTKLKRRTLVARHILQLCGINTNNYPGTTIGDIAYVEQKLDIGVLVFDLHTLKVLKKPREICSNPVVMLMDGNHFHSVKDDKVSNLWNLSHYCRRCYQPYQKTCAKCKSMCFVCKHGACASLLAPEFSRRSSGSTPKDFPCADCGAFCFDQECLTRHSGICKSNDDNIRHCKRCDFRFRKGQRHRCAQNAQTFILQPKATPCEDASYAYYDFECTLDDGVHNPAIIVMYDEVRDKMHVFESTDEFVSFICTRSFKGYTFIAHNSSRYDFHFLKKVFIQRRITTSDLGGGRGILYSELPDYKIRFVDSVRFLQFPLRKFPSTFGFDDVTKGYFPYTFFTKDNLEYVGPLPDKAYFDFARLNRKEREKAELWYNDQRDSIINLKALCIEYCKDDVKVLARGCQIFREIILQASNQLVDPFQLITIAGTALKIYLLLHMPINSIPIIPPTNLTKLFEYEARQFYCNETVAFYPCYESGCPLCFGDYVVHRTLGQFMVRVRHEYEAANPLPHEAVVVRECDWVRLREKDQDIRNFLKILPDESPYVHPRYGFFGGRTEVFIMYRKCRDGERIRYLDFTSLYPSIQFGEVRGVTSATYTTKKNIYYPLGSHELIEPEGTDISNYFGFIKCRIRSPEFLLYPVLPVRTDDKLLFPLGTLTGTWCTEELHLAVRKGYTIERIYQVWHYPEKSNTLFRGYVSSFLKMKQEAAGWKKLGCHDPESRRQYCQRYHEEMGIDISPGEEYNSGMYKTSKILLNSLWGKFAQRLNYSNTVDTCTYEDFAKVAYEDEHIVKNVVMHDETVRSITYEKRYDCVSPNLRTNVAIAAFTTAHARVRLYEVFEQLEGKLLYCDTDSVIFIDDGTIDLVCGEYLGDLTDELSHGDYIQEFIATAPKSYAYRTASGKECVKMKGITLDGYAEDALNFDTMKDLLDNPDQVIQTKPLMFDVDEFHNIRTRQWEEDGGKITRYTFNKRQRTEDHKTVPIVIDK